MDLDGIHIFTREEMDRLVRMLNMPPSDRYITFSEAEMNRLSACCRAFDEYERDIPELDDGKRRAEINFDVVRELVSAKAEAPPHVVKGIDAMLLMAKGYTCREIGERMGAGDNLVSAYVSKARKFLKGRPKSAQMMEIYAA